VTAALFELLVTASLSGSQCVAKIDAAERAAGGGDGWDGREDLGVDDRARQALAENVSASKVVVPG
jgi:hypothetical protein